MRLLCAMPPEPSMPTVVAYAFLGRHLQIGGLQRRDGVRHRQHLADIVIVDDEGHAASVTRLWADRPCNSCRRIPAACGSERLPWRSLLPNPFLPEDLPSN